eukprot:scaffold28012_cov32-Tisochrysis_lutea.AAC.1
MSHKHVLDEPTLKFLECAQTCILYGSTSSSLIFNDAALADQRPDASSAGRTLISNGTSYANVSLTRSPLARLLIRSCGCALGQLSACKQCIAPSRA